MEPPAESESPARPAARRAADPRARAAAELLARHRLGRRPFAGFPEELRPRDEDDAYAIQAVLHELLVDAGRGDVAGRKIGCTTPTMQAYLGIDQPAAGGIFAPTVHRLDASFRHADYVRPGVECELAVRLGRDLDPAEAPFARAAVEAAVESVTAAIEIVDDRYANWRDLDLPALVSDDFFGAACVLGSERRDWRDVDLTGVFARMTVDGVEVGSGTGAEIMGDPLAALAWLADASARYGFPLQAGSIVLLGSIVQTHWVEPSAEVVVENVPFGRVSARFE